MSFFFTALLLGLALSFMGLGIYLTLKVFRIPDITTDGSYTLGAVVSAVIVTNGQGTIPALIISVLAGFIAGAATGFIHTRMKVNALLAGILVMTALYSINLMIMGRSNLPLINSRGLFDLVSGWEHKEWGQLLLLASVLVISYLKMGWLLKTDLGLAMRATGSNEMMATTQGISVNNMKVLGLAIANAFTALSGSMVAMYQGFADINMGIGIVILGLGAVMMGEALMDLLGVHKIIWRLLGVIAGTVVFRLLLAFALSAGLDPNMLKLVTAILVLLFVGLPGVFKKYKHDLY